MVFRDRSRADESAGGLRVVLGDQEYTTTSGLTFGRAAEIEIDTNPHLHGVAGEFVVRGDRWLLLNRGSWLFLTLVAADGSRTELAPGAEVALTTSTGAVRIAVGTANYELQFELDRSMAAEAVDERPLTGATRPFEVILTPREVDFLVTFARPYLEGSQRQVPSYQEVADLWNVSAKTLGNTLQALKRKMRNARIVADAPIETIARLAISHSLITVADLEWADFDGDGPNAAADGPRFGGR